MLTPPFLFNVSLFFDQYLHMRKWAWPKNRFCDGFITNILVGIYVWPQNHRNRPQTCYNTYCDFDIFGQNPHGQKWARGQKWCSSTFVALNDFDSPMVLKQHPIVKNCQHTNAYSGLLLE